MRRQHFVVQLHESDCSQYTNLSKWMSWLSTRTQWRVPAAWKKVSSRFVGGSVSQDVCLWIIDDKLIDFFLQCFSTSPIISHLRMCVCVWKRESCTECQHDATHTQSPITQHTHTHTHTDLFVDEWQRGAPDVTDFSHITQLTHSPALI